VANAAGLVGRKRVLDSTPIYDAVATMDTITLIRSAIRGLLRAVDPVTEQQLRAVLVRDDGYVAAGKPCCDFDDPDARVQLVDALARDGMAALDLLEGRQLCEPVSQAVALLGTVLGQDLDRDGAGVFRIVRRVAKDRVISTVDPQARHGHKTAARGFDGYKGHIGIDPDSELVTSTTVSAGNAGDASVAEDLIADLLDEHSEHPEDASAAGQGSDGQVASDAHSTTADDDGDSGDGDSGDGTSGGSASVYGDNAYGTGPFHDRLHRARIEDKCKTQQPVAAAGMFTKDRFDIDLEQDTVTCPAGVSAPIRRGKNHTGTARFGRACTGCPLREQCTRSAAGRTVHVGADEQQLADARRRQRHPDWVADYRATRPKVERKIGHLMRRRHGGRRARVRGTDKVAADFALLAAAVNLARLGVLTLTSTPARSWATMA